MPTTLVDRKTPSEKPEFVLTGRMVLVTLVLFFLVIATVNAIMMTLAIKTMPGTVTSSAYQASQRFNQTLAEARSRDARGWQVDARVTRDADHGNIHVQIGEVQGVSLHDVQVKAHLVRPAYTGIQAPVILVRQSANQFTGRQTIDGAVPLICCWRSRTTQKRSIAQAIGYYCHDHGVGCRLAFISSGPASNWARNRDGLLCPGADARQWSSAH